MFNSIFCSSLWVGYLSFDYHRYTLYKPGPAQVEKINPLGSRRPSREIPESEICHKFLVNGGKTLKQAVFTGLEQLQNFDQKTII